MNCGAIDGSVPLRGRTGRGRPGLRRPLAAGLRATGFGRFVAGGPALMRRRISAMAAGEADLSPGKGNERPASGPAVRPC